MPRIAALDPAAATGAAKTLLDAVHSKLGLTPNLMRTLATAPAALEDAAAHTQAHRVTLIVSAPSDRVA